MKKLNRKIPLYINRSIGEKINSAFDFAKENFSLMIKLMLCFVLPISILQGMALIKGITGKDGLSFPWIILLYVLIAFTFTNAIVYSLMRDYQNNRGQLVGVKVKEYLPSLFHSLKKMIGVVIIDGLFIIPAFALGVFLFYGAPVFGVFFILAVIMVSITVFMIAPHFIINDDDESIFQATKHALRLGFHSYGSLLGLIFVMYLIVSLFSSFFIFPLSMIVSISSNFTDGSFLNNPVGYILIKGFVYIITISIHFLSYLLLSFFLFAMGFHYGTVANREDNASLASDIEDFENL